MKKGIAKVVLTTLAVSALVLSCANPMLGSKTAAPATASKAIISGSLLVEVESYSFMAGVQLEACSEGGQDVGYIDAGDWMVYPITVSTTGNYKISYRIASPNVNVSLSSDLNAGSTVLGSVAVTNTGGWQNWATVTQTVKLTAGNYNFGVNAGTGGFNLNWINFEYLPDATGIVYQTENFTVMNGVITEACSEGGLNVGAIDVGDWMVYSITIPSAGSYIIQYRVSSIYNGKSLSSDLNAGATQLGTVAIPYTGSWQSYTTVSQTVNLPAGTYNFGINGGTGGFNINWFSITANGGSTGVWGYNDWFDSISQRQTNDLPIQK